MLSNGRNCFHFLILPELMCLYSSLFLISSLLFTTILMNSSKLSTFKHLCFVESFIESVASDGTLFSEQLSPSAYSISNKPISSKFSTLPLKCNTSISSCKVLSFSNLRISEALENFPNVICFNSSIKLKLLNSKNL